MSGRWERCKNDFKDEIKRVRVKSGTIGALHELLVFFDELDQELAESVGGDETYLYELTK